MRPRRWRNFSFTAALSSVRALSGPGQSRMSWKTTDRSARPAAGTAGPPGGLPAGVGGRPAALSGGPAAAGGRRYLHGRLDLQVELDDLLVADPHRHAGGRRHLGRGGQEKAEPPPPGPRAPPRGREAGGAGPGLLPPAPEGDPGARLRGGPRVADGKRPLRSAVSGAGPKKAESLPSVQPALGVLQFFG